MSDFLFSTVPDVLSGPGTSGQLGELAAGLGIERALVVTDPGIIQFGLWMARSIALTLRVLNIIFTLMWWQTHQNLW